MEELNEKYWSKRYEQGQTGWDIGYASTPIKEYVDQLSNKDLKILIPGCGNGHEAAYLWEQGFKNVHVVDLSALPLDDLKKRCPDFPLEQLIHGDFFDLDEGFDLILEQTFYCALNPELRPNYASKMHDLLREGGQLVGLLFDFPLTSEGPPFGGSEEEYRERFTPEFELRTLAKAHNSIPPRAGKEFFIILKKNS